MSADPADGPPAAPSVSPGRLVLNDGQRAAVESRGVDICVEAGAGTGKTRVLTERVVRLVTEEKIDLSRVLAITFTTKAAQEMKVRLATALLECGVETAREDVEAAPISTIHAFCARLLRDHAVEAGIDPGFAVMDERQSDRAVRDALGELTAELGRDTPEVLAALASLPGADPAETLLEMYTAARDSLYAVGDFVRRTPAGPTVEHTLSDVRTAVRVAAGTREGASDTWARKLDAAMLAARSLPPSGGELTDVEVLAASIAVTEIRRGINLQGKAGVQKEALSALKEACTNGRAVLATACQRPLREQIARVLERLERLHVLAKGDGAMLDYADLERRAVALLDRRDDVRTAVQERHAEVLVDEFQDTSPVQARLLEHVCRPGAFFVVGDPKQSIYGFRGADVDVFLERLERVEAAGGDGGLVVRLDESYRARPEVTGFVNQVFAGHVSPADGEADVRGVVYEPLIAPRAFAPLTGAAGSNAGETDDPGWGAAVEVLQFPCAKADDGREAEARFIAERIALMIRGTTPLALSETLADGSLDTRPAGFGDVAILLRAMSNVKLLERELTARDIPYLVVKGRGFYEAREVVDLGNLFLSLDDPTHDIRFAAVLRSPFCGVSDDGLFALSMARHGKTLAWAMQRFAAGGDVPDLPSRDAVLLRRFASFFADLRAARGREPLAVLVDRALVASGMEVIVLARPNGRQRAANLRKVREMAIAADRVGDSRSGHGALGAFAAALREMREREVRETEATIAGSALGAVRIMTVHASKGLEFPIVFVPDLARQESGMTGSIAAHAVDGMAFKDGLSSGHPLADAVPHDFAWIKARNAARDRAESQRILYVALTRAEERLVLTAGVPARSGARPWWDRIAAVLPERAPDERAAAADVELGPGADPDGTSVVRVRLHPALPPASSSHGAARSMIDGVARLLREGKEPTVTSHADGPAAAVAIAKAQELELEALREAPPARGTLYATTVSALVAFARCPEEFRRRHLLGIPESLELALALDGDPGTSGSDSDDHGATGAQEVERAGWDDEWGVPLSVRALGRAAHLALERLAPGFDGDVEAEVAQALRTETGGGAPSPSDVTEIAGWVRGFANGDVGRALRAVPRAGVRREQAVLLRTGRTVVRGQIDLLFHGDDGWTIVDYKAGRVDAVGDAYAVQMRLYALALRGVAGELPVRTLLWSLPEARAIDIPSGVHEVAELETGLLADFAARTEAADYRPPAERPCFNCAYRSSCALSLVER